MQCANCGHDNPEGNKFCGECGQLLNDPHQVGRFSVMQSRSTDPDALSASREGVDPDHAPFPQKESVPREYFDQWKPIDPDPSENSRSVPVAYVQHDRPNPERTAYAKRSSDTSILGLSEPEPARPASSYVAVAPEQHEDAPVHGPSFLGLDDTPPDYTYTYEDPKPPRTRMWLALAVVAVLAILAALQWRAIGDGLRYSREGILRITLPLRNGKATPPATAQEPASTETQTASSEAPQMVVEEPKPPAKQVEDENPPAAAQSDTPAPATSTGSAAKAGETTDATGGAASAVESETPTAKTEPPAEEPPRAANNESPETDEPVETASAKPPRPAPKREAQPAVAEPTGPAGGEAELRSALAATDPGVQSKLLWRAVGKGNVDAQVRLADMYANGVGVPQSCDQAMVLMRSASAKPNVRARVKMGSMYAAGKCVGQDRVAGYRWMGRALELDPGSDWVRQNRESLWAQMSPDERARAGRR